MNRTTRRCAAALAVTTLTLAACGGSDADESESSDSGDDVAATAAPADDSAGDEPVAEPVAEEPAADEPVADEPVAEASGTFEPGPISFRTVNLSSAPVDIYAITNGLREAFPLASGVAPGDVTDFTQPPNEGRYLILEAGATDPTCVIDCVGHISELFSFEEEGPTRTVLVYDNEEGEQATFEIWEQPTADRATSSNSMPAADAGTTLVSVTPQALVDPPFGLRLAVEATPGCAPNLTGDTRLIGGNQVLTFDVGIPAAFTLHDFEDEECATALAGPFTVDAAPGARVHALLSGEGTNVDVLLLPMVDGLIDGATSSDGDRQLAVEQMTAEVVTEFGLDETQAACTAELLVDQIGADLLLDDTGTLVDLDSFDDDVNELAGAALFEAVDTCGVDPAVFGG